MAESKATIPHFQIQAEATVDALLDLRAQLKREKTLHPVPSINDLIVKAAGLALREFPLANGTFRDGSFELHEQVNVGIAVAARDALVVPVISAADSRPIAEISTEARRLAERVRDGSVTPPELAGGTFTVSNLEMFGMSAIFPVINPGQGAILGVGASRGVAVIRDGELAEQQLLTLTLSCDHRILYGAEAAQFLGRIVGLLERPLQLLL
jgi:pyruvate dehydrogenase E2 component (dihydrolipoamide acetyltransferase)